MKVVSFLAGLSLVSSVHGRVHWAADFSSARNSREAGFGNVQTQNGGGSIQNNGPAIPVVNHPILGNALNITLNRKQMRLEAAPGAGDDLDEGAVAFIRVDFVLGNSFPVDQDNPFCLINQVHQASSSGSPPIEFDVHDSALWIRGASTGYNKRLTDIATGAKYKLVYGARYSSSASKSLLNVWINDEQILNDYVPGAAFRNGGDSY